MSTGKGFKVGNTLFLVITVYQPVETGLKTVSATICSISVFSIYYKQLISVSYGQRAASRRRERQKAKGSQIKPRAKVPKQNESQSHVT